MSDDTPTTLYVGNLDRAVSEDLLCALFSHIGIVRSCKIIREKHTHVHICAYMSACENNEIRQKRKRPQM
ncbi:nucleolysin TIA-1-like [Pogonomyrmex barbatus]|uniref:Nucleolysin TIA-1-like n=1 Tax=Pogonomyrmex barbatus TaxID=144034 RepID=A0A6I9W4N0_9HYME|nr:nucleolysin TIA-1-like [Pogonomyrmex barbatus]